MGAEAIETASIDEQCSLYAAHLCGRGLTRLSHADCPIAAYGHTQRIRGNRNVTHRAAGVHHRRDGSMIARPVEQHRTGVKRVTINDLAGIRKIDVGGDKSVGRKDIAILIGRPGAQDGWTRKIVVDAHAVCGIHQPKDPCFVSAAPRPATKTNRRDQNDPPGAQQHAAHRFCS